MNRSSSLAPDATSSTAGGIPRHQPVDFREYLDSYRRFFDEFACVVDLWKSRNPEYHRAVRLLAQHYIAPGSRVLEVGCGTGDLLSALSPSDGVGVGLSAEMVRLARTKYPGLRFHQMAAEELDLGGEKFDYIVLSDAIPYFYDIREVFSRLRWISHPKTRVIIHWYSRLWQPVISIAERMG